MLDFIKVPFNDKKSPVIPPLFYKNHIITDFKEKAELFSFYLMIAFFLVMSIILLTNVYLQLHFQPNILQKSFKI